MKVIVTLAGLSWLFAIWIFRFKKLTALIKKKIIPVNLIKVILIDGILLILLFNVFGKTPFGIQVTAGMNVISTIILNMFFPKEGE